MRYLFLVQGEGRGHMTQALTLAKILTERGHQIVHTFIGKSERRTIPEYFFDQMPSQTSELISPNFVLDNKNKSLNLWKTITHNAKFLSIYKNSLDQIHEKLQETQADVLVNFYDFLGGLYFRFYHTKNLRHVCIGRQFLSFHPSFPFETGRFIEKKLYMINNRITSQKCDKYLALSFRPYDPPKIKNLVVVPPLLKEETKQSKIENEDFILAYMVNDGYAEELIAEHKKNQTAEIRCFWDRKNMPDQYSPHKNLTFFQINHVLFTDFMSKCKGFITTAGFESVCEALYLQKPVMMMPVQNQYEQACNALDGEIAGAGIRRNSYDIASFLSFIPHYQAGNSFRAWTEKAEEVFEYELSNF